MADFPENQHEQCLVPPLGWACSRPAGHEGPCAATRALREVVTVCLDPIAALRKLADDLEASPEKVHAIGIVTLTGDNHLDTYGYGPDGNLPQVCLMMQAAIQRCAKGYD